MQEGVSRFVRQRCEFLSGRLTGEEDDLSRRTLSLCGIDFLGVFKRDGTTRDELL